MTTENDANAEYLTQIQGNIERCFVSQEGYFLLLGWLADEGHRTETVEIKGAEARVQLQFRSVLRHARLDIEAFVREGAYDYGFVVFGRAKDPHQFKQPLAICIQSNTGVFLATVSPEIIADKRLLDTFLIVTADAQCHSGKDATLLEFLRDGAAALAVELFSHTVNCGLAGHRIIRFRPRSVKRSFVTVLFGTAEPILLQPVLFHQFIEDGEWIFVCNSPLDADSAVRYCRLVSDLYDLSITAVLLTDNVGFGAANNLAVHLAASDNIYLINPDVYPMAEHALALARALDRGRPKALRGGLLFYDHDTLMHSGMYVDRDPVTRAIILNQQYSTQSSNGKLDLLRVEHFDKSIPFDATEWTHVRPVPAVTGAAMAFHRNDFERIGGFSLGYIYGHYEDADLSLRWSKYMGAVEIDPQFRLVHLEGQGSRQKGPQFNAAAFINRYLFSINHG